MEGCRRIRNCPLRIRILVRYPRIGNMTIIGEAAMTRVYSPIYQFVCVFHQNWGSISYHFDYFRPSQYTPTTYVIHNQAFPNSFRQFYFTMPFAWPVRLSSILKPSNASFIYRHTTSDQQAFRWGLHDERDCMEAILELLGTWFAGNYSCINLNVTKCSQWS